MTQNNIIKVQNAHLEIKSDPSRMKVIAEAVREYCYNNGWEDNILLDLVFYMETNYQAWYGLDSNDFGYASNDRDNEALYEDQINSIRNIKQINHH